MDRALLQWNDNYIIHLGTRIFFCPHILQMKQRTFFFCIFLAVLPLSWWWKTMWITGNHQFSGLHPRRFFWWYWRTSRRPHTVCLHTRSQHQPKTCVGQNLGMSPFRLQTFSKATYILYGEKTTWLKSSPDFFFGGQSFTLNQITIKNPSPIFLKTGWLETWKRSLPPTTFKGEPDQNPENLWMPVWRDQWYAQNYPKQQPENGEIHHIQRDIVEFFCCWKKEIKWPWDMAPQIWIEIPFKMASIHR